VLELDAIGSQLKWRCPNATGCHPPDDTDWMDARQLEALDAVERLTGARGFKTCPSWYASLDHVHEAVRAYEWWDKGQLHLIDPHPSSVLVEAIGLISRGITERQRDDFERMKRENDEARRKRETK
jgi:hypothetical protein